MASKQIEDGGAAFPRPHSMGPAEHVWEQDGMTLRDYFAGQALAGYMACASHPQAPNDETMARYCYNAADAMLQARKG
jgi:hypothetical protein